MLLETGHSSIVLATLFKLHPFNPLPLKILKKYEKDFNLLTGMMFPERITNVGFNIFCAFGEFFIIFLTGAFVFANGGRITLRKEGDDKWRKPVMDGRRMLTHPLFTYSVRLLLLKMGSGYTLLLTERKSLDLKSVSN